MFVPMSHLLTYSLTALAPPSSICSSIELLFGVFFVYHSLLIGTNQSTTHALQSYTRSPSPSDMPWFGSFSEDFQDWRERHIEGTQPLGGGAFTCYCPLPLPRVLGCIPRALLLQGSPGLAVEELWLASVFYLPLLSCCSVSSFLFISIACHFGQIVKLRSPATPWCCNF